MRQGGLPASRMTPQMRNIMMRQLINTNPQAWNAWQQARNMANGKTDQQRQQIVENLAKERGMTMDEVRSAMLQQYGIEIPQW